MFSVDNVSTVSSSLLLLNGYETSHNFYLNEEFFLDVKSTLYEISGFVEAEQDSLLLDLHCPLSRISVA